MYRSCKPKAYRPNTKKIYEEHHGAKVPKGYAVHHKLPLRLGGTHDVSNLAMLDREAHIQAHLGLYEKYGDVRDLCASYMLRGLPDEARKVAAAEGGRVSNARAKARGQVLGFGAQTQERRKEVASVAGSIGGAKQRDLGMGIHVDAKTRSEWAKLGAAAVAEQFSDPEVQASRGKRGGVKNKGFKWCHDGVRQVKYTAGMQADEPFDEYLARTGMKEGKGKSDLVGSKFYNDGERQFMFSQKQNAESYEEFIARTGYKKGRLKNEDRKHQATPAAVHGGH